MKKKRSLKRTVFVRILSTFIIILMPMFFIAMAIFNMGVSKIRYEIEFSMQTQIDFFMQKIENDVQRIRVLQNDMLNDDNLKKLAFTSSRISNYDRDISLLYVHQRLKGIAASSAYIKEVRVYIPTIDMMVSNLRIDELNASYLAFVKAFPEMSVLRMNYWNGKLFLCNSNPDKEITSKEEHPYYIIEIEFSLTEFIKILDNFNTYKESRTFIFNNESGFILYDAKDKSISNSIKSYINNQATGRNGFKAPNMEAATGKYEQRQTMFNFNNKNYMVFFSGLYSTDFTLVRYIPEDIIFENLYQYRIWVWIYSIITLIIITFFSFYLYRFIHRPLSVLTEAFNRIKKGDMDFKIEHDHQDEFIEIYSEFNTVTAKLSSLISEACKQKILVQDAKLKQLQSQINPHFLYNSFFILNSMSRTGDYEQLEKFTNQLGEYFQFITRDATDEVALLNEVNHARIYADILAIRFCNRIKVIFEDLPEQYFQLLVPRIILQPIIENAFKHSLEKKMEGGLLCISFEREDSIFRIVVKNNGDTLSSFDVDNLNSILENVERYGEQYIETTAVINIHRRLQIKFGSKSGLKFLKDDLGELKVIININMQGEN